MTITQRRTFSFLVSLAFLLCVMVTPFFAPTAYAASGRLSSTFGSWMAAMISAINIALTPVTSSSLDLANFLSDPLDFSYTYSEQSLDSYLNQSVIKIAPNSVTIDGQEYDEIWLSADAAEKFRVNAFDFASAYSIASNTNGTFVEGKGTIDNLPLFTCPWGSSEFNGGVSQLVDVQVGLNFLGGSTLYLHPYQPSDTYWYFDVETPDGSTFTYSTYAPTVHDLKLFYGIRVQDGTPYLVLGDLNPNNYVYFKQHWALPVSYYNNLPFDFDYVSSTIPGDTPMSENQGLSIRVPHHSGSSYTNSLEDFISDYPEFTQSDGLTVDSTLDPDIYTKLDDLINIIAPIIPIINKSTIAEMPVTPQPSQETIADTQYTVLGDTLNNIIQTISGLGDRILEDIEIGPIRVFDKALDLISTIFAPVFAAVRSALGIWHHVTTWLASISAPFTFILNALSYTPIILYPVYAVVAGTLCISIYRRFGK